MLCYFFFNFIFIFNLNATLESYYLFFLHAQCTRWLVKLFALKFRGARVASHVYLYLSRVKRITNIGTMNLFVSLFTSSSLYDSSPKRDKKTSRLKGNNDRQHRSTRSWRFVFCFFFLQSAENGIRTNE